MAQLLDRITAPADIKTLSLKQLRVLAQELRADIIGTVSTLGGHFASSLGAIELVIGLHYVFDAPEDKIVWDMGYQAYAHKILTGRRQAFQTSLKQAKGLSGFCNKDESVYDLFTTGHGGTSISTAMGLAMARDRHGERHKVIAVIGDASLGEGMALEGLNHAGHLKDLDLLVILNDNKWSIAPSIGGISRYLNRIITAPVYNRLRDDVESLIKRMPRYGSRLLHLARQVEEGVKGMLVPGRLFEDLGFRYFGPIDGHDQRAVNATLRNVKRLKGPILIHLITQKGKGYTQAEQDPERYHKFGPFDVATGEPAKVAGALRRDNGQAFRGFTDAFTRTLVQCARADTRIVAISAAMLEGTGLGPFMQQFPDRCFDVGMAEQHGVGFCAGMARGGLKPVVAMYSTFLQRAYDQVFHEVCLQQLPVVFMIDRAGLVGEDGPTHHGIFDIAYLRALPDITVMAPRDEEELAQMLHVAIESETPVSVRYPRGRSLSLTQPLRGARQPIVIGQAEMLLAGEGLAILALGSMAYPSVEAARQLASRGLSPTVVNARFVKPLDRVMLRTLAERHDTIVTVEEAALEGGFGSAVLEAAEDMGLHELKIIRMGIPTSFVPHGTIRGLLDQFGLSSAGIAARIAQVRQPTNALSTYSAVTDG